MAKPVLAVFGARGMLGAELCRRAGADFEVHGFDAAEADITKEAEVRRVLEPAKPDFVVNCAAYTDVEGCESNRETAFAVNGGGAGIIAREAARLGAGVIHLSTDYVFDGEKTSPYLEDDPPNPLSAYGASKLEGEVRIRESGARPWFVIRTSWLYGRGGKNFVKTISRLAMERETLSVVADQHGSPTYAADLAEAIILVAKSARQKNAPSGVYHFSNEGGTTWHGFAEAIRGELISKGERPAVREIRPVTSVEYPQKAARPKMSEMNKDKFAATFGLRPRGWREALSAHMAVNLNEILAREGA